MNTLKHREPFLFESASFQTFIEPVANYPFSAFILLQKGKGCIFWYTPFILLKLYKKGWYLYHPSILVLIRKVCDDCCRMSQWKMIVIPFYTLQIRNFIFRFCVPFRIGNNEFSIRLNNHKTSISHFLLPFNSIK